MDKHVKTDKATQTRGPTRTSLDPKELRLINAWWHACNYLSVGMIYLRDNPLLKQPLQVEHIKHRLLGHWGASPALSFVWVHLNRLIKRDGIDVIFMAGPGHGAPGVLGPSYLEGTYSEVYPDKSPDAEGMQKFFKQFSFPGHIGSHVTPETPGSIHEGGELGYSLSHAYGACFDNPELIVACVVGDGEAETGPLATAWHSNKFVNPIRDGAVLPILNLNGYKIANPTILARISHEELETLLRGYGYTPYFVEGDDPDTMHQTMAATLETAIGEIRALQTAARSSGKAERPRWPMIVLRSPKGWTGPKEINGHKAEGSWRSHQVPFSDVRENPAHLKLLQDWMRSYKPEELFDANGTLSPELRELAPTGPRRMSANLHVNGGLLRKELKMPDFRNYAVDATPAGTRFHENTRPLGEFLRDVMRNNMTNFRLFGPDETASNRLQAVYEVSKKVWMADLYPEDADGGELSRDGRVMEMLSEHTLIASRAALPHTVEHAAAVHNLQRSALFLAALDARRYDLLWEALQDRLHQSYRQPLIPGLAEVLAVPRTPGLLGVALSGAGPTVIALATKNFAQVGKALADQFERRGLSSTIRNLTVAQEGTRLSGKPLAKK